MEGAKVRRLDEHDIGAAIALTDLENWGYTRADFVRLLTLSPEGCFVVEAKGCIVGVLTTTTYDGLAFLGAVIGVSFAIPRTGNEPPKTISPAPQQPGAVDVTLTVDSIDASSGSMRVRLLSSPGERLPHHIGADRDLLP